MKKVSEIMTTDVATIPGSARVSDAVNLMRRKGIHTLIVDQSHEQDAYGIVTAFDIVAKVTATGRNPRQVRVYEIMTKPCLVLNPELGVEYAAKLMTSAGIHTAPIIQWNLLGILSVTDILNQGDFLENPQEDALAKQFQALLTTARATCKQNGAASDACRQAWDAVDAVEAEAAYQKAEILEKTAFEEFCEEYPEAFKDREYDTWCSG
ncbi:Inosine-5'-monophosphate dehydrogenase [Acaryochloris thomasi RCC1774]|uniref:Inosine-5'-monophosphate dehydrogenase n=1 Tax=Acaryochloris thomasi RCC1774 TaxID=1764569 RepID=A0A2W1J8N9_9CYAN|nr:CBS domain-containing protein [Acaryochloris thomasi]PZD70670.1 Inosine-5'-monophosphate dehydrogenase [Acaryochloris thomasi RCC1774]